MGQSEKEDVMLEKGPILPMKTKADAKSDYLSLLFVLYSSFVSSMMREKDVSNLPRSYRNGESEVLICTVLSCRNAIGSFSRGGLACGEKQRMKWWTEAI
jgi:hypothetical protein